MDAMAKHIKQKYSILLLCDDNPTHASMILDHIDALCQLSTHKVYVLNPINHNGYRGLDFNEFDVVIIHYSLFAIQDCYLPKLYRDKLRDYSGLKIQFIQDDYRCVNALAAEIRRMKIDILYTLVPESEYPRIWWGRLPSDIKLVTWIAGYVPDRLVGRINRQLRDRPIDVGYRGRVMPYWLGSLANEKIMVGKGFLERARSTGLRCDISWLEEDRIYGDAWDQFNQNCRAMLGCGSGASIADFDGSAERAVKEYLSVNPTATFDEVADAVLKPYEGNINLNVISPRQFEAIAAGTALVLFNDGYSGILQPWRHYLPLEKDFSNFDEIVARIKDLSFLEQMTARAYADIIQSRIYSYHNFIAQFDALVRANIKPNHLSKSTKTNYWATYFAHSLSLKSWASKIAFQLANRQPVKVNIRIRRANYVITLPFTRLWLILYTTARRYKYQFKIWLSYWITLLTIYVRHYILGFRIVFYRRQMVRFCKYFLSRLYSICDSFLNFTPTFISSFNYIKPWLFRR